MNFKEEKKYVGHSDQLFKVRNVLLQDGKAKNVRMVQVDNRSGMQFEVSTDRGMDIHYLSYKGENIGYISACGMVAPEYFDDKGLGFLKSFTAGFLTTCGLSYVGKPCEYKGKSYGLHGNISNTPAECCTYSISEEENSAYAEIKGTLRESVLFGPNLILERNIRCDYKDRKIVLRDKVTNEGYKKTFHMILYHINIGYPMLSKDSEIFIPSQSVKPRNEHSKSAIERWNKSEDATPEFEEMCYYHTLKKTPENRSAAAVFNPGTNMGIAIEFNAETLDHFVEWKMMGAKDYVLGLEPGNATIDGIEDAIDNGSMKYLDGQESVEYELVFHILEGRREFDLIKQKIETAKEN